MAASGGGSDFSFQEAGSATVISKGNQCPLDDRPKMNRQSVCRQHWANFRLLRDKAKQEEDSAEKLRILNEMIENCVRNPENGTPDKPAGMPEEVEKSQKEGDGHGAGKAAFVRASMKKLPFTGWFIELLEYEKQEERLITKYFDFDEYMQYMTSDKGKSKADAKALWQEAKKSYYHDEERAPVNMPPEMHHVEGRSIGKRSTQQQKETFAINTRGKLDRDAALTGKSLGEGPSSVFKKAGVKFADEEEKGKDGEKEKDKFLKGEERSKKSRLLREQYDKLVDGGEKVCQQLIGSMAADLAEGKLINATERKQVGDRFMFFVKGHHKVVGDFNAKKKAVTELVNGEKQAAIDIFVPPKKDVKGKASHVPTPEELKETEDRN